MSSIDEVMKDFNKKYKDEIIHKGVSSYDYERIPFTSTRLNYMSYGGIPIGKLIEFYGEEHGGKTTTALDIVANYQKLYDRTVLYLDAENTLDTVWATKLGVDVDALYIVSPTNQGAETLFQLVLDMIDTGEIGLVILDSLGVMVSNQAMGKSIEDKTYAGISMALTQFSNRAEGLCKKHSCTLIGINQLRDDLNSTWGGTKTVGGRGWKHNASVRIEFMKGKYVDEKGNELPNGAENPVGNIVNARMTKNKTCSPNRRRGYYTLNYLKGINRVADLVDMAIQFDIIQKAGAWYSLVDVETGEILDKFQGQSAIEARLESDTELFNTIMDKVLAEIEKAE